MRLTDFLDFNLFVVLLDTLLALEAVVVTLQIGIILASLDDSEHLVEGLSARELFRVHLRAIPLVLWHGLVGLLRRQSEVLR